MQLIRQYVIRKENGTKVRNILNIVAIIRMAAAIMVRILEIIVMVRMINGKLSFTQHT